MLERGQPNEIRTAPHRPMKVGLVATRPPQHVRTFAEARIAARYL
jgi:hypothetical protein